MNFLEVRIFASIARWYSLARWYHFWNPGAGFTCGLAVGVIATFSILVVIV